MKDDDNDSRESQNMQPLRICSETNVYSGKIEQRRSRFQNALNIRRQALLKPLNQIHKKLKIPLKLIGKNLNSISLYVRLTPNRVI